MTDIVYKYINSQTLDSPYINRHVVAKHITKNVMFCNVAKYI